MTKRTRAKQGEAKAFFAEYITVETDDCVLWPFALNPKGYGIHKGLVHTRACEQAHGPRPEGMQVCHSCLNKHCFNPRHLRWDTPSANQMDRVADGTSNRGEQHPLSKLTETDVHEIRRLLRQGLSQSQIGRRFDTCRENVRDIGLGRRWGHLPIATDLYDS